MIGKCWEFEQDEQNGETDGPAKQSWEFDELLWKPELSFNTKWLPTHIFSVKCKFVLVMFVVLPSATRVDKYTLPLRRSVYRIGVNQT